MAKRGPSWANAYATRDIVDRIAEDTEEAFIEALQKKYDEGWELISGGVDWWPCQDGRDWEYWAIIKKLVRE